MKTSRKIIKNMFSLTIAEVANKGIVFIFTAYLARITLTEGFGIISFANAILVYFLLFVNLGFNVVGAREIAKSQDQIRKYANTITTIRALLAVIAYAVLFIFTLYLNKPLLVKQTIWIAGLNLFANAILLDWIYQGIEKMEFLALRQVFTSLLNLIGVVLLVHSKNDIVLAMLVTFISTMLNSIWMLMLYIKMYGKIKFELDWSFIRPILKSSIPITFTVFSSTILNTFNIIILGIYRTNNEIGLYNAAYKILLLCIVPSVIIQNAFFPTIARAVEADERRRIMKKYIMLLFFIAAILSTDFLVFSDFIINVVFGNNYIGSVLILQILMVTTIMMYYNISCSVPLNGWNKEKDVMISILIGALINIILNIILIPKYGAIGAAWGTVFSEFSVGIGLTVSLIKTINKIYIPDILKFILFACISCSIGYLLFINGIPPYICGILALIIYFIINYLFKTFTINEIKGYFAK